MTTGRKRKVPRASGAAHRSYGRRFSHEQQQEYVSLDQCSARLSSYGWIRNELKRDHGEDILIQIYENGASTGLAFFLQCKSTTDLAALALKKDPTTLSYDFEVADLLHWAVSTSPIVAIVWDVRRQEGRWALVSEVVRQLDARPKGWRHRATVAVHIPSDNGTDDRGLFRLRRAVADHYLPLLTRQHEKMTVAPTFRFPNTAEGKDAHAALQAFFDTGAPVTIDGKFVKEFRMPDWWERAYGHSGELQKLTFGPASSSASVQCRLELEADGFEQPIAVPYVDLRHVRGGRKEMVLSNSHQQIPIHIEIGIRTHEEEGTTTCSFSFDVEHAPPNVYEARDAAAFSLALHTGRRIRLVTCTDGRTILETPFPRLHKFAFPRELLERWHEILQKLCYVQPRISRFGTVRLTKGWLRAKDEAAVRRLYTICTKGEEQATGSMSWVVTPETMTLEPVLEAIAACERDPSDLSRGITIGYPPGQSLRVANVTVPLGRIEFILVDSLSVLRQLLEVARSGAKSTKMEYKNKPIIRRYPDWLPGGKYVEASP